MNTCVALLVVTLRGASAPSALPLLGVLVVLLVVGYRVYIRLARGYTRLQLLYRFVGSTGHTSELEEAVSSILSEAAGLLHATTAQLLTAADRRWSRVVSVTWRAGAASRTEPFDVAGTDAWWAAALAGGVRCCCGTTPPDRPPRARRRTVRGTVSPSRCGRPETVEAVLLVTDRTFEEETFGARGPQVFETLAAHAAVALDKARVGGPAATPRRRAGPRGAARPADGTAEPAGVQRRRPGGDARR